MNETVITTSHATTVPLGRGHRRGAGSRGSARGIRVNTRAGRVLFSASGVGFVTLTMKVRDA